MILKCILTLLYFCSSSYVPYQFDPRIHTLGNIGTGGKIHAVMSPLCTWLIDKVAYDGTDIRTLVKNEYAAKSRTLDLCCGTGYSSTNYGVGVDTSIYMLQVAKFIHPKNRQFILANAEDIYLPRNVVTCMFALHEIPRLNRIKLIKNAIHNAIKKTVIVDIHETYKPSKQMLDGEPYILDYIANCKLDIIAACSDMNKKFIYEELIHGHVQAWIIE